MAPFKICLITNRHLVKAKPMLEVCRQALEGGVDCILLREPDLNPKTLVYVGRQFRMLTKSYNALLLVKDRVDVAKVIGADGVHLGADSIPPEDVRRIWDGLIGYSAHTLDEVKAYMDKVDYFFLSPIFHTRSKPMTRPLGLEVYKRAVGLSPVPVYPLGGVVPERVKELVEAGAPGVVAMSCFFSCPDPRGLARSFKDRLEDAR